MKPVQGSRRPSGIPWVGDIPAHWQVKPLRSVVDERDERNEGMVEDNLLSLSFGHIVPKDITANDGLLPESFETYQVVEPGDVVLRLTDLQNDKRSLRSGLVSERGIITSAYTALKPTDIAPAYLGYLLRAYDITKVFYSMGGGLRQSLKYRDMRQLPLILPPPGEQTAIATFLDRETGKIDALVKEQRRLIDLLKEKRQAAISDAVTKGLDPHVKMKPSGVEWLGDVPAHWDLVRIGDLFRFVKRQNGDELEVLSVYRDYGVIPKASRDDNINKTPEDLSKYQTVFHGDLVVNKMKAWQGSVGLSDYDGITSPDYAVFEPRRATSSGYLNWLLRCNRLPGVYRSISNGIRPDQWRLEPDKFKSLRLPLPTAEEQRAVDDYLTETVGAWIKLVYDVEVAILLLLERRAALISAAVTGKIDVQHAAPTEVEAA